MRTTQEVKRNLMDCPKDLIKIIFNVSQDKITHTHTITSFYVSFENAFRFSTVLSLLLICHSTVYLLSLMLCRVITRIQTAVSRHYSVYTNTKNDTKKK